MQQGNAVAILRSFEEHRSATINRSTTKCWQWSPNTIRFPDAICPWCQATMRSCAVWLVDENAQRLNGQVRFVGGKAVKELPNHPHVNSEDGHGSICMGENGVNTAYQALFIAFNLQSMYWDFADPRAKVSEKYHQIAAQKWRDWLLNYFGHTCGTTAKISGLSAELKAAEKAVAKPVVLATNEVAVDTEPIFSQPAAPRRRRTATADASPLFDGSLAGGGINA